MSSSILRGAGLGEFIADDIVGFGAILRNLSLHKDLHRQKRQSYQERNLRTPLFDTERVSNQVFEALLRIA